MFDYVDGAFSRFEKEKKKKNLATVLLHVSQAKQNLNDNFGAHWDALADKLFALPVWTVCLMTNATSPLVQLLLCSHIVIESYSAFFRTKSYYLGEGSTSVVTAQSVGKMKQAISMLGTSFLLMDETKLVGGGLLLLSLPFAVTSIWGKVKLSSSSSSSDEKNNTQNPHLLVHVGETDSIEKLLTILNNNNNKPNEKIIICTSNEKLLSLLIKELEHAKIAGFALSPLPKDFHTKYNIK